MTLIVRYSRSLLIGMALWGHLHGDRRSMAIAEELPEHAIATLGSNWLRHAESVSALAFSPNGDYLVSGGSDRYLRIWDLEGGRLVHQLSGETDYGHNSVAFSPDGLKVAAVTGDGIVRMWDLPTGLLCWERQLHEDNGASQVEFFSTGQRIASSGNEGMIVLSDVETGKTETSISYHSRNRSSRGLPFAISPDDSSIAMGNWGDIEIVTVKAPNARTTIAGAHSAEISSLCYTPDGTGLLSCGASRERTTLRGQGVISLSAERKLWSLKDNRLVRSFEAEMPDAGLGSGRISSDGRVIATAHGSIEIWDLESGQRLRSVENWNRLAQWYKNGFVLSPNNRVMAAVDGAAVLLWDTQTGARILDENPAHKGAVTDVTYSSDGLSIASAGREGDVRIWDRNTRTLSHALTPLGNWTVQTDSVVFSPDGGRVLAGGTSHTGTGFVGTLSLWNTVNGKSIATKLLDGRATCVQFSSSGKQAIVGAGIANLLGGGREEPPPRIYAYDEHVTKPIEVSEGFRGRVLAIHPGIESVDVYFVEDSASLWHWKTESNTLTQTPLKASRHRLKSAAFNGDGSVVATSGLFDETIYLWETATGAQLAKFAYKNTKGAMLAFSPDGRLLAVAPIGLTRTTIRLPKNVVIWDTKNDVNVCELQVTMPNVSAVAFSPNGQELLTGHEDGTSTLWKVP